MHAPDWLTQEFERNRNHLRIVAYRMLGSLSEADDAVQEAWLRLSRSGADNVENLGAWLTTVVARICMDMLRSRTSRREDSLDASIFEPPAQGTQAHNPEQETLLADSVGLAVMVVLDRLAPAERLAFVLHDMFGVSFDEIAAILGRSPEATRQLASRARRRVQGTDVADAAYAGKISKQRPVVEAFLAALRNRDFEGLVAVLDPDVHFRADEAGRPGTPMEIRGAENWAKGAIAFSQIAPSLQLMLVDGNVGLVLARHGKLERVLKFSIVNDKIIRAEAIADPERLKRIDLAVLR